MNGQKSESLEEAKLLAESSTMRNVGITVETRPDYLSHGDIEGMLDLGVTRVEVGVQNVYDDLYNLVDRGHTVQDVVDGTRRLKDAALKVCYHMMPGLPGSTYELDLEGFRKVFEDPIFKPDMLKIYPTLVVKGTKLYELWRRGEYTPISTEDAVELVAKVKEMVPPWIRIMRVQRDIPVHQIEAGVDKSNLRQLAQRRLREHGMRCRCIRCREVGHRAREGVIADSLVLTQRVYEASGGTEVFISVEDPDNDVLVGFLRLRLPSEDVFRPEITVDTGLVRELHVYGSMTPVGKASFDWQHRGWGAVLMEEAEMVAKDRGMSRIVVMSALGTKEYYQKLGYVKDGLYVSKPL
jgi:elongator complex protein 3